MCYKINSNDELDSLLSADRREIGSYDYALHKTNFCHIYLLSDQSVVLQSSTIFTGVQGIHFNNVKCLNEMIDSDYFPLYDPVSDYECFNSIEDFRGYLNKDYEHWLKQKLNIEIDLVEIDLQALCTIFQNTPSNPKFRVIEDVRYLYLIVGLYLMNEHGQGQWGLEKRYGKFNPYYWPFLKIGDNVYSFYQFFREVYMAKDVDLSSEHGFNFYLKRKLTRQTRGYLHKWSDLKNRGLEICLL